MRLAALLLIFCAQAFSHGLFYSAKEGKAIIINANFSQSVPAAYAEIAIYKGASAIPLLTSAMDNAGNFAFLPPEKNTYRVQITATSDHGNHVKEFSLNVDETFSLQGYQEAPYHKYASVLGALGVIFGLFGLLALFKSRKA